MKKIISIVMLALCLSVFSQAPSIQWQQSYGGSSDEFGTSIQQTFDGGYIVAGNSLSSNGNLTTNHGMQDYWILKLDAAGIIQWQHSYGGTNDDIANCIRQTNDSGFVIAGYSESNDGDVTGHHGGADTADYWIIKLNKSGILQWEKSLEGTEYDVASSILQTSDSGYIVAGLSQSSNGDVSINYGISDYWIVKLNSSGTIQWEKAYGGSNSENATVIQQTFDSGFIIAGSTYSNDGDVSFNHGLTDYWLVKISASGNLQWEKTYGGTSYEDATSIQQTTDSGFVIAGSASSNDGDVNLHYAPSQYWIVKTDSVGTIKWQKDHGGQSGDEPFSIIQTSDGGYIATGRTGSNDGDVNTNHGVWDCWLFKLNSIGNLLWQQCYGGPWDDGANSLQQTSDGGFIFAGHSMLTGGDVTNCNGAHDFWVVKLNAPVGINEVNSQNNFSVFPNPSDDKITIQTSSETIGETFSITDQTGRKILTGKIFSENTIVATDKLAAGFYILQIGEQQEQSIKIIKR